MDPPAANPIMSNPIVERFIAENPASKELHERALGVLPGGIAHDLRRQDPFPFYITRASGARKWDADGHELIDYGMGHGALILGHGNPAVADAVARQLRDGTHPSACHPLEIAWAERVVKLVPSAELVRFVASGTEATMMAMRLARAFTRRDRILRVDAHFHGWNDYASIGYLPSAANHLPGIPQAVRELMPSVPQDLDAVEAVLQRGDIAGAILEPTGASWATIPMSGGFLQGLRELTTRYGALLIFDEVISGFRWSPGGVQGKVGVKPDLTTLAKILAGGLPGGAVAGRRDVMELLRFKDPEWNIERKVLHNGTFNANPLSAAAGVACLDQLADGRLQALADGRAARLRQGLNQALNRLGVAGCAWGEASVFHVLLGVDVPARGDCDLRDPQLPAATLRKGSAPAINQAFELAMWHEGVHLFHSGGLLSIAHDDTVIARTLDAFSRSLTTMRECKLL
jgi:glutamate-1-semialdehyde 2,1-aminomutase